MVIDQRNAGASVSIASPSVNYFAVDRFQTRFDTSTGSTTQRSSVAPAGFTNSNLVTVGTGATPASSAFNFWGQRFEGFNMSDFGWGTASAQSVTLSFWVRSSLTGTFGISLRNASADRSYVASYVINAANTWEQKAITITGDTGGTWDTTNGVGAFVFWDIGQGSSNSTSTTNAWQAANFSGLTGGVKLCQTSGATFYITGVQLEKGSTATSFDYRPYTTELQLCQRYLPALNGNTFTLNGYTYNSNANLYVFNFPVTARVAATGITVSSVSHFRAYNGSNTSQAPSTMSFDTSNPQMGGFTTTQASGFTIAQPSRIESNNASALLLFTGCEL
jgi:hypothetical protein